MRPAPEVTVMMPAYDSAPYLRASIESVLRQNFKDFELVIVDDGSRDRTSDIAAGFRGDPRVRLYRNPRRIGVNRTTNRILGLARGRYVIPHDSDDVMLQGRIREQYGVLESRPEVGFVFGNWAVANENLDRIDRLACPRRGDGSDMGRSGVVRSAPLGFHHAAAMIRKTCLRKVGGYDPALALAGDERMFRRLFEVADGYYLNRLCFVYRVHGRSVTQTRYREVGAAMRRLLRARGSPRDLTIPVGDRLMSVRPGSARMHRTLRWRLNYYLRNERPQGRGELLDLSADARARRGMGEDELYRVGFLEPLASRLAPRKASVLGAGLVSMDGKGILILAPDRETRSRLILLLLFHAGCSYHSFDSAVLQMRKGKVYGRTLLDPLVLSGSRASWGEILGGFWNPWMRRYCVNVDVCRPDLIGDRCLIKNVVWLPFAPGRGRRITLSRMSRRKLRGLLARDKPFGGGVLSRLASQDDGVRLSLPESGFERAAPRIAARLKRIFAPRQSRARS